MKAVISGISSKETAIASFIPLHSSAWRASRKLCEADVFHTRQQHSIKVAQVGRRLGQALERSQQSDAARHGLDAEVVEAACLAHDLGHPPFGHIGEKALHDLVVEAGESDGFDGNAQSFRIVTKLAVRFPEKPGIDLTRATLAAMLKYPWTRADDGPQSKKWSVYKAELKDFEFAREFFGTTEKSLEAELMDWSDDVAYSVHDLEDFHRCNVIPWRRVFDNPNPVIEHAAQSLDKTNPPVSETEAAYGKLEAHLRGNFETLLTESYEGRREQREQLRRMTSQLIGKYIRSVSISSAPFGKKAVDFREEHVREVAILKQITRDYIIAHPPLLAQQHGQKRIITDLFREIYAETSTTKFPAFLPMRLRYLHGIPDTSRERFTSDCIASLSEREAIGLHGRLFGTATGSVLDPIVR